MVFSSLTFLCLFLPIFLVAYYMLPKFRTATLVIFSVVFYAFGEPVWVAALLFSGSIDYFHGLIIAKYPNSWQRRAALVSSLVLNLGLLATFKYAGFIVGSLNSLLGAAIPAPGLALPLGISFYTFQTLSYTVDVYRGEVRAQRSFMAFMSYVTMFPQLVAGPIVRYADIESRLARRRIDADGFSAGITRFACGLGKKVLLANAAGDAASTLLSRDAPLTVLGAWLGILFFAFQIYFDFSGYSDMAIGLGKMIGFEFKENFQYPYAASSITDFWRRWHISLSTFFRDYVYIPLGGSRRLIARNILVVWLLTGLWHGASWNFILWGAYYGAVLLLEKFVLHKNVLRRLPHILRHIYTMFLILIGWSIFYFTDLPELGRFLSAAFGGAPAGDFRVESVFYSNIFLLAALAIASTPLPSRIWARFRARLPAAEPLGNMAVMALCFISLVGRSYNPFLYFRF
ncbi:MAG: MBOAT family protein [Oscillospiraceae bacterium]|jgi:alginate O-acetyltransferase complex protein AlgI|nr:MBOAT family protein [Oscillospiraceae bacterium]